jgi:3-phosphoshikimate 1-carboxyvinyltransferase
MTAGHYTVPRLHALDAEVKLPGSKSYTNRYIAIAALSGAEVVIENALLSDDTRHFAAAVAEFGHVRSLIDEAASTIRITPTGAPMRAPARPIYLAGAGTPLRFLISMAALADGTTEITGNARMQQRPMGDLLSALAGAGVSARSLAGTGSPPIAVTGGGIPGGATEISGRVSSQFTSSLLISAVRAARGLRLRLVDDLISKPYVDMTVAAMHQMGAAVERDGYRTFTVAAGQSYHGGRVRVEADASAMSYPLAAAAVLGGRVRIHGIGAASCQGDVGLARVLAQMGCAVEITGEAITLKGGQLHGIDVDMTNMPDVVPTLAVAAAYATGTTRITGIASLRVKECDRVHAVATELAKMGVEVAEFPAALTITGGEPAPAVIDTYDDHRIAMSFAIAGLRTGDVAIRDPGCVAKSFPAFWQMLDSFAAERG